MYMFMTLRVFVLSVARAVYASGFFHSRQDGLRYALEIVEAMELDCDSKGEVEVSCRKLWLELFQFQEYREITSGGPSYADRARTILREVMSASVTYGYW